ncbi:MAG: hypothetical protein JO006_15435 [Paucibacter sp.]|nr:hypothetical protein [Roseateles sp.]
MAEKFLSELEWKRQAKTHGLKDALLSKALGALENGKTPDAELKALDDIDKQIKDLRKEAKGNKELSTWLDGLEKAADKQRKESEFALKKQAKEDEEEDTPVLLTTKMIPLLRQVKKGEEMQVMLASTGKEVAVLMSRKAISPTRRKLLADYLEGSGMPKFFLGHCIFEEKSYTFVLKTQAAGLAKKIKAALLKQVELRLKVRVRGEEGDLDDDGEPPEEDEGDEDDEQQATHSEQIPEAPPLKEAVSEDPLKAEFVKRWAAVQPMVLDALRRQAGDTSKLRAVAEFVREKGEAAAYKAALQGIDSLQKLMGAPPAPPLPPVPPQGQPEPKPEAPKSDEMLAFNKRLAALLPEAKAAIAAGGEPGTTVKLKISEAGVSANKKEFERAYALLDEAQTLLKNTATPEPVKSETPEQEGEQQPGLDAEGAARFDRRMAEIEPGYLALLAARNPDAGKLRSVLAYANAQAEGGDYVKAVGALDRLQGLIEEARGKKTDGEPPAGIVAYRTSLLGLRQAVAAAERQIAALRAAIVQMKPDEVDLADDVAELLQEQNAELQDLVDAAMSATGDKAQPATRELRDRLDFLIGEIKTNEMVKLADESKFDVKVTLAKTLGDALDRVRSTMPAVA